jgi:hypothetical protein
VEFGEDAVVHDGWMLSVLSGVLVWLFFRWRGGKLIGNQRDELEALWSEVGLIANAGDEISRQVTVGFGGGFDRGDNRRADFTAAGSEADRLAGSAEGDFPGFLMIGVAF